MPHVSHQASSHSSPKRVRLTGNATKLASSHHFSGRITEDGQVVASTQGMLTEVVKGNLSLQGELFDSKQRNVANYSATIDHESIDNFTCNASLSLQEPGAEPSPSTTSPWSTTFPWSSQHGHSVAEVSGGSSGPGPLVVAGFDVAVKTVDSVKSIGIHANINENAKQVLATNILMSFGHEPDTKTQVAEVPTAEGSTTTAAAVKVRPIVRHVQKTVMKMKMKPQNFSSYDEEAARKRIAKALETVRDGATDMKVKVTFVYSVKAEYEFSDDLTTEEIRRALRRQCKVQLEQIIVTIINRRLSIASESRGLQAGVKVGAEIKTEEVALAQGLQSSMADTTKMAAALTEETGRAVAAPQVANAPQAEVNIETEVERTIDATAAAEGAGGAEAVAAPPPLDINGVDLASVSQDLGGSLEVTDVETTSETRTLTVTTTTLVPTPAPSATTQAPNATTQGNTGIEELPPTSKATGLMPMYVFLCSWCFWLMP